MELERNPGDPNNQITGFEEFYADPPIRPEEALEEEVMYDPRFSVATYLSLLIYMTI